MYPGKTVRAAALNMNAHPQQAFPQNSQVYPQTAKPQETTDNRVPERQIWGTILSSFFIIVALYWIYDDVKEYMDETLPTVMLVLRLLAYLGLLAFHLLAVVKSDYLAGKPSFLALAPLLAYPVLLLISSLYGIFMFPLFASFRVKLSILVYFIQFGIMYAMYSADDDSGSCCLCSKPWVCKRPIGFFASAYPQYPPQPAYYPQGYPPQHQAYPPQQQAYPPQGYPPQQQAYPPQGYPPQQQAYPPQKQDHPTHGYPPQGHLPQQQTRPQ